VAHLVLRVFSYVGTDEEGSFTGTGVQGNEHQDETKEKNVVIPNRREPLDVKHRGKRRWE